jgi:hypothetical protein
MRPLTNIVWPILAYTDGETRKDALTDSQQGDLMRLITNIVWPILID